MANQVSRISSSQHLQATWLTPAACTTNTCLTLANEPVSRINTSRTCYIAAQHSTRACVRACARARAYACVCARARVACVCGVYVCICVHTCTRAFTGRPKEKEKKKIRRKIPNNFYMFSELLHIVCTLISVCAGSFHKASRL